MDAQLPRPDERIRFDVPNTARMWNYWLGGTVHYPLDRSAADAYSRLYPQAAAVAKEGRKFLARCVTYLAAELGIRQFLDIGTGFPVNENTHQIAQAVRPDAKIVYVDNDPVVLAYARAWLTSTTREGATDYLDADLRQPESLIASARHILDRAEPIAVLLVRTLGYAAPSCEELHSVLARLVAELPEGSYLALCEGVHNGDQNLARACARHGQHLYTPDELLGCLTGLDLLEPGLVPVNLWRPTHSEHPPVSPLTSTYAVLARKPGAT